MQVTDVRIFKTENARNPFFRGSANVTLDDAIVIHNISIIEGRNGLFLSFPSRRNRRQEFVDIVHPINADTRAMIQEAVLAQYNAAE